MTPAGSLIFGLGLFFLGLRLVSDNLRGLAGNSLRGLFEGGRDGAAAAVALGFAAGALLQSATAVTFICAGMVTAGILSPAAASGVILWSNTGLTLLAYVATLNIHPYVALGVGWAGIAMGLTRNRSWRTGAAVVLGIGLIILGLQQMGSGAAPLKNEPWFRSAMDFAESSPLLAFAAGIAAAAALQSNTGAAMMFITLTGAEVLSFRSAAVMIYGSNLGAIALRLFLSSGMRGDSLRLVRLEDLFCLWSGAVMMALYFIEQAGVPGVLGMARALSARPEQGLAFVFTVSNALPALLAIPLLGRARQLLLRLWPDKGPEGAGSPRFLQPQAIEHPATALDLLGRELGNLLMLLGRDFSGAQPGQAGAQAGDEPAEDFEQLAGAIEKFFVKLGARGWLMEAEIAQLQRLRAVLSGIRHLEEATRFYKRRRAGIPRECAAGVRKLDLALGAFIHEAAEALITSNWEAFARLQERSRRHGQEMETLKASVCGPGAPSAGIELAALSEDFELAIWTFHRIVKGLAEIHAPRSAQQIQ